MRSIGLPELIVAFGIIVVIPVVAIVAGVMIQRFRTQERLRAIEKGLPPDGGYRDLRETATGFRVGGMVLIAVSLGLVILFLLSDSSKDAFGVPAIPGLIGIALLIEYRLRAREQKERERTNPRS